MNERRLRIIFGAWLFVSVPALIWFDNTTAIALFHLSKDEAGNLIFINVSGQQRTGIYPFTLLAALLSLIGIGYFVYIKERKLWAIPVAALVARASTLGMINLYEQVYVGLGSLVWTDNVWSKYYGRDLSEGLWTIVNVLWVITSLPWWDRRNLKLAGGCFLSYLAVMLVWFSVGYPPVESGSTAAYVLNAISRFLSQGTQVLLVLRRHGSSS